MEITLRTGGMGSPVENEKVFMGPQRDSSTATGAQRYFAAGCATPILPGPQFILLTKDIAILVIRDKLIVTALPVRFLARVQFQSGSGHPQGLRIDSIRI
ncbi:MAG: hypothetical protein ACLQHF_08505 [Terracidiphilus sp.]